LRYKVQAWSRRDQMWARLLSSCWCRYAPTWVCSKCS